MFHSQCEECDKYQLCMANSKDCESQQAEKCWESPCIDCIECWDEIEYDMPQCAECLAE